MTLTRVETRDDEIGLMRDRQGRAYWLDGEPISDETLTDRLGRRTMLRRAAELIIERYGLRLHRSQEQRQG